MKTYRIQQLEKPKLLWDSENSPIHVLGLLSTKNWLFFSVAFLAWTWDAFDFFSITLIISDLAEDFGRSTSAITLGLTLSLIPRFIGAAIFGIAADRYGRKWPFIFNNALLVLLELLVGFCRTFEEFLVCRTFFGVAMGGIYGNAAAIALEDCPRKARGLMSGVLQSGYSFGCLLAAVLTRGLVNTTKYGWRPLFWFGACPPVLVIIFRWFLGETEAYEERATIRNASTNIKGFVAEAREVLKSHWVRLLYLILLMTAFSTLSHGSQDIFPKMLSDKYDYSTNEITKIQLVANIGAILGGAFFGFGSQIIGRRLGIVVACTLGAILIYPYYFTSLPGLYAAVFFEQFCIQGAFGIVPIHLVELSPPAFSAFVVGTSYNLGVLIASPTAYVETWGARKYPLPIMESDPAGAKRYNYSIVMAIFLACSCVVTILLTILGPEHGEDQMEKDGGCLEQRAGVEGGIVLDTVGMNHSRY
ncbi:MFS general substrate transporter [Stipitochalara longipes BDJ]|nr:MFS general substrate transporter [Stipitochalara longipes BDJ]